MQQRCVAAGVPQFWLARFDDDEDLMIPPDVFRERERERGKWNCSNRQKSTQTTRPCYNSNRRPWVIEP